MIALPAGLARQFAAVARRCVPGKPHGPPPDVVCRTRDRQLAVHTRLPNGVVLTFTAAAEGGDGVLVVPFEVFAAISTARGPVELRPVRGLQAEARWADPSGPQAHPFQLVKPGRHHDPPAEIADWTPAPPALLAALHACGKATARGGSPRFALERVCLSGVGKRVVGSDSKVAVLAGPFPLPFADDRLVPAVPVFGCPELTAQTELAVGTADGVLAVKAGPWCVRLPVEAGRYPDVASYVPKNPRCSVGGIDEGDARELLARLKGLPGHDAPSRPVTLVLSGGVHLLAADEKKTERVPLPRSTSAGPPVRVALDRTAVARALKLGCLSVRVWTPDRPVAFEGGGYTVLVALLVRDEIVADPVDPAVTRAPDPGPPPEREPEPPPPRRTDMPSDPPAPASDPDAPLALAERLRLQLSDAHTTATKLMAALRGRKKEQRALAQVYAGLKSLNLSPDRD